MAAASLSLEGALARRRLADGAAVVVVHGRFAQSVPWLSRFIAAKVRRCAAWRGGVGG